MTKGMQRKPLAHAVRSLAHVTQQKWEALTLALITRFAAEIMLLAFLNQRCERPSSGFECHLPAEGFKF